jgi:hypothetical protein
MHTSAPATGAPPLFTVTVKFVLDPLATPLGCATVSVAGVAVRTIISGSPSTLNSRAVNSA